MSVLVLQRPVVLEVRAFPARRLDEAPRGRYDVLLATLGYEPRAVAVAQALGKIPCAAAPGFEHDHEFAYEDNRKWFDAQGFDVREPKAEEYRNWLQEWLHNALEDPAVGRPVRIAIDISSMTRDRIAIALETAVELSATYALEVDFLYAPAEYREPPVEPDFTASIEPVTSFFRGWTRDPSRQSVAVVGLGYEIDKAVGAKEYLELKDLWAYIAHGGDERFAEKVRDNNELLWMEVDDHRIVRYHLSDPYGVFVQLESQLFGILRRGRALMLPMGPKIFALCSLLAAMHHHPEVGVWRVRQSETPQPREPNGELLGLTVSFGAGEPGAAPPSADESIG